MFLAAASIYIWFPESFAFSTSEVYEVFPILAILLSLYILRIYRFNNASGRAQILIASGLIFWGIGCIVEYVWINFLNSGSALTPADAFYLLNTPLFAAGIWQGYITSGIKLKQVNKTLLAGLLSVSIVLTILVLYFGVYLAYDSTADFWVNIVNITYGVTDLVLVILALLTFLVSREYAGGKLASFWITMTIGFFLFLIADILYAMYPDMYEQGIAPYAYIDLIWIAAALVLAYGLLDNYLHITAVQKKVKMMLQQRNNPIGA
jgi:hypothetical protein